MKLVKTRSQTRKFASLFFRRGTRTKALFYIWYNIGTGIKITPSPKFWTIGALHVLWVDET